LQDKIGANLPRKKKKTQREGGGEKREREGPRKRGVGNRDGVSKKEDHPYERGKKKEPVEGGQKSGREGFTFKSFV